MSPASPGTPAEGSPGLAVLDIDGTLSDTRHRLHHLRGRRRDWGAFFAAAGQDPLHPEGLAVATELAGRGHPIVYLSGRPERLARVTTTWLADNGFPPGDLQLRPHGDRRPATTVKLESLRRLAERGPIVLLLDDDPKVVEVARASGLVAEVLLASWQPDDIGHWS